MLLPALDCPRALWLVFVLRPKARSRDIFLLVLVAGDLRHDM